MTDQPSSESSSEPVDPSGPPDPVDELLRRTMRALDAQTPPALFEALPRAVEAAIDAGAGMGDSGLFALGAAGDRGDRELDAGRGGAGRGSASQLRRSAPDLAAERGQGGGRRRASSVPMPAGGKPAGTSGLFAVGPAGGAAASGPGAASAARDAREVSGQPDVAPPHGGRAKRRSMLETQVGAPLAWWQTRTAAVALIGVALAAAVVLVVLRQSGGHRPEESIGASSNKVRDSVRRAPLAPVRPPAPVVPALTPEQKELRQQLAGVLPGARACVGPRPIDGVALEVQLGASGKVEAVVVRGELASPGAEACIKEALGAVVVKGMLMGAAM